MSINSNWYRYQDTDIYVLELKGEIRGSTQINILKDKVSELIETEKVKKVVIHQTDYNLKINSEALGQLLRLNANISSESEKDLEEKVKLKYANIQGHFESFLKIKQLNSVNEYYGSLKDAIYSYQND